MSKRAGFWERLQEAFNYANAPEIAKKLDLERQAVYKWREGNLPSLDTLLAINRVTGCSLHWLITGEGERKVEGDIVVSKSKVATGEQLIDSDELKNIVMEVLTNDPRVLEYLAAEIERRNEKRK